MALTTKTPFRLEDVVLAAFVKEYKIQIDANGACFTANEALAEHLRAKGHKIPTLVRPKDRIAAGQKRRWRAVRKTEREIEQKREAKNEARRERRAKRKAEAEAATKDTEIA